MISKRRILRCGALEAGADVSVNGAALIRARRLFEARHLPLP